MKSKSDDKGEQVPRQIERPIPIQADARPLPVFALDVMTQGTLAEARVHCPDKLKILEGAVSEHLPPLRTLQVGWEKCWVYENDQTPNNAGNGYFEHTAQSGREIAETGTLSKEDVFSRTSWEGEDREQRVASAMAGRQEIHAKAKVHIRPIRKAFADVMDAVFRAKLAIERADYAKFGVQHSPSDLMYALRQARNRALVMVEVLNEPGGGSSPKALLENIATL